ncbi:putative calpain-1 catalytic subunit [Staphylotrichum tortipilum]|uniref:Calpain-1 catalytic subunit n=1 Tax=Staphylotrichum tortipilum TaxID=2831512 RepID=A0AAN6MGE5_9PEZI|nr:putative calpain-1 catalytic subunit [Staphylotrichum longicolle]
MSVFGDPRPGRVVVAELPIVVPPDNKPAQHPPQRKVDQFWRKFTTKSPGKATTLLPPTTLTRPAKTTPKGTTTDAVAHCRAKVAQIVAECRRINQKYRDPHFDLDFDLRSGTRDCLEALSSTRQDYGSSCSDGEGGDDGDAVTVSGSGSGSERSASPGPPPPPKPQAKRERKGARGDRTWPGSQFTPQSVKRVGEIFDEPKFYIDGPTASDVRQGRDGDCWLMAALCTLSNKPGLIERVCVARDEAVGVYGFVFHRDGGWFSEIIDDQLYLLKLDYDEAMMGRRFNIERALWEDIDRPDSEEKYRRTYQSGSEALFFAACENSNETWLPLLEKAYAKAHGDYAAIEGGFTGEGIEDLTGGVTTELVTSDILDKDHFWEELMRVNQDFLFGCSTGLWGLGYGQRKGIQEGHAYSVMRAVEMDGQRLLLLKNPWGKGEWTGPWSDGSKEWTSEWLTKLGHRFGDDGAFWMSYKDLLRKFQTFDRTRLFGPEWNIASAWTTLNVAWAREYHETKFCFTVAKPGPVVIVFSQLDDRYFRGFEGEYWFGLGFRIHKNGEDDYLVRTHTTYYMSRSCNVELDLEPGEYTVLVRIDAERRTGVLPPEDVVRLNAKSRREKLLRIGLAYDLAHDRARIVETPEEKAAREAYEKWRTERQRERIRKMAMKTHTKQHYIRCKERASILKDRAWAKEVRKRREEQREARKEAKAKAAEEEAKTKATEEEAKAKAAEEEAKAKAAEEEAKVKEEVKEEDKGVEVKEESPEPKELSEVAPEAAKPEETTESKTEVAPKDGETPAEGVAVETEAAEPAASTDAAENTPPESPSDDPAADPVETEAKAQALEKVAEAKEKPAEKPTEEQPAEEKPASTKAAATPTAERTPSDAPKQADPPTDAPSGTPQIVAVDGAPAWAQKLRTALEVVSTFKQELEDLLDANDANTDGEDADSESDAPPPQHLRPPQHHRGPPPSGPRRGGPHHHPVSFHPHHGPPPAHRGRPGPPPPPPRPPPRSPGRLPPQVVIRGGPQGGPPPPLPPPGCESADDDSDSGTDICSIRSPSEVSERELDYLVQQHKERAGGQQLGAIGGGIGEGRSTGGGGKDAWNAVAVVGLRVYYQGEDDGVRLRVVRPERWVIGREEEEEGKEGEGEEGDGEVKVLDVDDSAKDAVEEVLGA